MIVGAGPGGGRLAAELAASGVQVLLVERLQRLTDAAFSSAALPLSAVKRFGIPASVVAASWRGWHLVGPDGSPREWMAPQPLGAVLDFGALRRWLAAAAEAGGGRLLLGSTALACEPAGAAGLRTWLRGGDGSVTPVESSWVVDASGERRVLLGEPAAASDPLVVGRGVEWLLEVGPGPWRAWADRLGFFLGSGWVQQGYGWVFPMARGQLKVGVCRLEPPEGSSPSLGADLRQLLTRTGLEDAAVLDRHGGRIRSTITRREAHGRGRLVGLGDAVSTANLLGGEGIRHALLSADLLAPLLIQAVRQERRGRPADASTLLRRYRRRLRRQLGWRWNLSGRLARRTWLGLADAEGDRRLERLLSTLEGCRAEDLSALLFEYRFERYGLKALPYLLGRR
ncbi:MULTISPECIES: NAD(P)/FAD-dependent oxidoreductase [Aphanothece]|uniref:NAD(P)/FAD-dependent oxidoreductase n=1 Tax=Aphanothece TaxID=1121 RepID=UPI003984B4B6